MFRKQRNSNSSSRAVRGTAGTAARGSSSMTSSTSSRRQILTGMMVGVFIGCILTSLSMTNKTSERNMIRTATAAIEAAMNSPTITTTTSSSTSSTTTTTNTKDDGWSTIDVFVGTDAKHLDVVIAKPDTLNKYDESVGHPWYSQVGQDATVFRLLNSTKNGGSGNNGYFLDLASNDATVISNSYGLETHHGWNGLCMEANPKYWSRLAYRKCQVVGAVIGANKMEEVDFNFGKQSDLTVSIVNPKRRNDNGMLGGIVGSTYDKTDIKEEEVSAKRYTVSLLEIFTRHDVPTVIDYFSLDVEGAEGLVMSTFPFDTYTFKILTVERPKPELKQLLERKGFVYWKELGNFREEVWYNPTYITPPP